MEMPYSLQTLPPEAIDILRFYSAKALDTAHADEIVDGANLSERGFGKGIRRLVTKNYLVMSSDQVYRLTDAGKRVVAELRDYAVDSSPASRKAEARFVRRRLVLIAPRILPANRAVQIAIGFNEADEEEDLQAPVNLLLRLAVLNGAAPSGETAFMLTNRHIQHSFEVTAGSFTEARLRVEARQYQDDSDDFEFCGGMYVDLPVSDDGLAHSAVAYGVDVILKEER